MWQSYRSTPQKKTRKKANNDGYCRREALVERYIGHQQAIPKYMWNTETAFYGHI